jgi:hypothetical protein
MPVRLQIAYVLIGVILMSFLWIIVVLRRRSNKRKRTYK